jgi:LysR family transcriptional activator of glutamate synthase operon
MYTLAMRGEIDLAIAALDVERPAGLDTVPLVQEPVLLAVPAAHPLAAHDSVAMPQLRQETFVLFKAGTGLRAITERAAGRAGFTLRVGFETASLDRLLALVGEGLGVALVPASTIRDLRPPGVAVLAVSPAIDRTVGAVWRAGQRHTPAARAFLALLHEHAGPSGRAGQRGAKRRPPGR